MARATQAIIHLSAIEHNYRLAKKQAPNAEAYAVIKANAYGHGLLDVAQSLSHVVDGFAVACVDEAMQLRNGDVQSPIMVLEGAYDQSECLLAEAKNLELVIHQPQQVQWLANVQRSMKVWIKVDTGMNRLGFRVDEIADLVNRVLAMSTKSGEPHQVALMSHFACADDPSADFNQSQLNVFQTLAHLNLPMSMSNSAAVLTQPAAHGQRLRPGIMLYGASPVANASAAQFKLRPAMTLNSEIIALHNLKAGETVGYGQTWQAQQDCQIAVVAIGYGDGYPRLAPNGTPVVINGQRAKLAGRVSMDMITVDVSDLLNVAVGDTVELWGPQLPADEIAKACQTIAYELFCQVTSRVPRIYHQ